VLHQVNKPKIKNLMRNEVTNYAGVKKPLSRHTADHSVRTPQAKTVKTLSECSLAKTPPMGWNSWDCFGVSVTEDEVKANADFISKKLKSLGWEYIVVDLGWYSPHAGKDNYKKPGLEQLIDQYGRLIPAPNKFPSSDEGRGFKPLADYIHRLGLKFGLHVMRGIPVQAVERNTPILGSRARARDIAQPEDVCFWYKAMYGINCTRDGAQAYYDSIAKLYASWGVDFIKADDMNSWDGDSQSLNRPCPYHTDEIEALVSGIRKTGRAVVLSLSPGGAQVCNANHLRSHANMWRISSDFWDNWDALSKQFDRCRLWSPYVAEGNWPDADMLPIGRIGIRGEIGEDRSTNFTPDEQCTLMTLWFIFRSPLMFGGHLPASDALALSQITNVETLAVNQSSSNNRELFHRGTQIGWIADVPNTEDKYLALFNIGDLPTDITATFQEMGLNGAECKVRDLWAKENLGSFKEEFTIRINPHGAGLYLFFQ
jgi:alpha-galactosidase